MLPADWATFFEIDIGAATALAGLLFVSFSIYNASQQINPLEKRMGTMYLSEIVTSFVIALAAVVPPHFWWVGGMAGSGWQIIYWVLTQAMLRPYRRAYRVLKTGDTSKTIDAETRLLAAMYGAHRGQLKGIGIPLGVSSLIFVGALAGSLEYFHLVPATLLAGMPLQLVGTATAWYLISSISGSWYFLFNLASSRNSSTSPKPS